MSKLLPDPEDIIPMPKNDRRITVSSSESPQSLWVIIDRWSEGNADVKDNMPILSFWSEGEALRWIKRSGCGFTQYDTVEINVYHGAEDAFKSRD